MAAVLVFSDLLSGIGTLSYPRTTTTKLPLLLPTLINLKQTNLVLPHPQLHLNKSNLLFALPRLHRDVLLPLLSSNRHLSLLCNLVGLLDSQLAPPSTDQANGGK